MELIIVADNREVKHLPYFHLQIKCYNNRNNTWTLHVKLRKKHVGQSCWGCRIRSVCNEHCGLMAESQFWQEMLNDSPADLTGNRKKLYGNRRVSCKHWRAHCGISSWQPFANAINLNGKEEHLINGKRLRDKVVLGLQTQVYSMHGVVRRHWLFCSLDPMLYRLLDLPRYLLPVVMPFVSLTLGDFSQFIWSQLDKLHTVKNITFAEILYCFILFCCEYG